MHQLMHATVSHTLDDAIVDTNDQDRDALARILKRFSGALALCGVILTLCGLAPSTGVMESVAPETADATVLTTTALVKPVVTTTAVVVSSVRQHEVKGGAHSGGKPILDLGNVKSGRSFNAYAKCVGGLGIPFGLVARYWPQLLYLALTNRLNAQTAAALTSNGWVKGYLARVGANCRWFILYG